MPPILTIFAINLGWLVAGTGIFLALVLLMHRLESASSRFVAKRLGWRGVWLTGWLGVPVHELSHLGWAWFFGHRIVAFKLWDPDPRSGTLGYVHHAHRRANAWQKAGYLFIGLAPLISALALLPALLPQPLRAAWLQELYTLAAHPISSGAMLQGWLPAASSHLWACIQPLTRLSTYAPSFVGALKLYLGICIAAHAAPSRADLRNAAQAMPVWGGFLLLAAGITGILGIGCAPFIVAGVLATMLGIVISGGFLAMWSVLVWAWDKVLAR